ncbi:MAG TPA: hypothetical protein VFJ97_17175 [Dermatophilaceae bacterium]|nr:hypothetical protein [Dermatophilaceae bacterium]
MSSRVRPALTAAVGVAGLLGLALLVVGLWFAVTLGPSGLAEFSVSTPASGAIAIEPRYANAVDVPFEVVATRGDGGPVWLGAARQHDADLLLRRGAHSVVAGLSLTAGAATLRSAGSGPLPDVTRADVWRSTAAGEGRARLLVGQRDGPLTVVVASGEAASLRDLELTLRWRRGAWFLQALTGMVVGGGVVALAGRYLWRRRRGHAAPPAPDRALTGALG